jgi:hypothetical protein
MSMNNSSDTIGNRTRDLACLLLLYDIRVYICFDKNVVFSLKSV